MFNFNWDSWFFNNSTLVANDIKITVETKQYQSLSDHAKHIFWFGRKSKRCFLTTIEESIN